MNVPAHKSTVATEKKGVNLIDGLKMASSIFQIT